MAVGRVNIGGGRFKTITLSAKNQTVTATTNIVLATIKPRKFSSISLKSVDIKAKNDNPYSSPNAAHCGLILREKSGSSAISIWSDYVDKSTKTFTISAVLGRASESKASLHKEIKENGNDNIHQYAEGNIDFSKELELVAVLDVRFPDRGDYSKIKYSNDSIKITTL